MALVVFHKPLTSERLRRSLKEAVRFSIEHPAEKGAIPADGRICQEQSYQLEGNRAPNGGTVASFWWIKREGNSPNECSAQLDMESGKDS